MAVIAAFDRLYQLKKEIRDLLISARIPDVEILCEFPARGRPYPLQKPYICVGIRSVSLGEGALGGFVGVNQSGQEIFGRKMQLGMRFDIYLPKDWPQDCHFYFCTLCDVLSQNLSDFGKMECGDIISTAQNDGFALSCQADLAGYVCRSQEDNDLTQIILRRNEM